MQRERPSTDVAAECVIDSPPAPVRLMLNDDGASLSEPTTAVPVGSTGLTRSWVNNAVLDIDLVTTSVGPNFPPASTLTVDGFAGAVWRVAAKRHCPPITISVSLPDRHVGHPSSGEHLESLEIETAAWRMSVGGYDDDTIATLIGTQYPSSWSGAMQIEQSDGPFGASYPSPQSLAWVLPGLSAGERFDFHVAIAWLETAHASSANSIAPWLAVDTTPTALLAAAGLGVD